MLSRLSRRGFLASTGAAVSRIGSDAVAIENEVMRVQVDRTSGMFRLIDKVAGQTWEPDPWRGAAGILVLDRRELLLDRATVRREGETSVEIVFQASGAQVKTRLTLPAGRAPLRIEVLAVEHPADAKFVDLEYPCRLGALVTDADDGYLVLPYLQGCLVPSRVKNWKELPRIRTWAWDDGPWMEPGGAELRIHGWHVASMPWFGAVRGPSALMATVETDNDASLRLVLNSNYQHVFSRTGKLSPYQRVAVTSPVWLAEHGRLGYARSMRYEFLPRGNYVDMAKRYRKYAAEKGFAVTLREKIAKTPALETIVGAPWVNLEGGYPYYIDHPLYRYTWKDARKVVDDLTGYVGAKRALLTLWTGYRQLPPDFYPFHPAQGPLEDLRDLIAYARKRNVLINFYHGYPALLDDAPNGDIARARKLNPQGAMVQRWGRNCPAFFLEHARKNLPPAVRDSGMICDYTDILTATTLNECWDPKHPLTRGEDRRCREETMRYITSLGLFSGSEWPTVYSLPHLSYFRNGGAGGNSHLILGQFHVPLFNLCFKDCALMYAFFSAPGMDMIRDLASGCHFQFTMPSIRDYYAVGGQMSRQGARENAAFFQDWNRATGMAELLSHQFVEELNGPYRTRFGDGSEALVNPTLHVREVDGQRLQPESLLLKFATGRRLTIKARTGWDISGS